MHARRLCPDQLQLTGWDVYSFPREMDRQGVPEDKWKLTVTNGPEYKLCPTYPQLMYIPKGVQVSLLRTCISLFNNYVENALCVCCFHVILRFDIPLFSVCSHWCC